MNDEIQKFLDGFEVLFALSAVIAPETEFDIEVDDTNYCVTMSNPNGSFYTEIPGLTNDKKLKDAPLRIKYAALQALGGEVYTAIHEMEDWHGGFMRFLEENKAPEVDIEEEKSMCLVTYDGYGNSVRRTMKESTIRKLLKEKGFIYDSERDISLKYLGVLFKLLYKKHPEIFDF